MTEDNETRQQKREKERKYPKDKKQINDDLRSALYNIKWLVDEYGSSRARSIAITHIEEAVLILEAEDRPNDNLLDRKPWEREGGD